MAKTMIEKIRETEAKGKEIILKAHETVNENKKSAAELAEKELQTVMLEADRNSAEIIEKAKSQTVADKASAERRGWAEGEKLSAKADKNRERAINAAIEIIFS